MQKHTFHETPQKNHYKKVKSEIESHLHLNIFAYVTLSNKYYLFLHMNSK